MLHAEQYYMRAVWALENARYGRLRPDGRSHLTAAAVHACQSLKEALDQCAPEDATLTEAIGRLPHVELIQNIRNCDLHGWPLPICDENLRAIELVTKPGQPIRMTSSHGVSVTMTQVGPKPHVHRSPKSIKDAKVAFGGATVSFGCERGIITVFDFCTRKQHNLFDVLQEFLKHCEEIFSAPRSKLESGPPASAENLGAPQS